MIWSSLAWMIATIIFGTQAAAPAIVTSGAIEGRNEDTKERAL